MADSSPLRLMRGDTLIVTDQSSSRRLLVIEPRRRGYLLRPQDGPDLEWSHDQMFEHYVAGTLEHFPANLQALDAKLADVLQADWESWPEHLRFSAECRETYCLYVDRLCAKGVAQKASVRRAARTVFRRHHFVWAIQANRFDSSACSEQEKRRRKGISALETDPIQEFKQPSPYAVRDWYARWTRCGRDVRALIPQFHNRGHREPRKTCKRHLQTDAGTPLCVYGAMQYVARTVYMKVPRVPKKFAYRELERVCKLEGFDLVSNTTFNTFLRRHFTDFEEYRARYGAKAAFFKYHLFARREAPERPLEEVEVDHTLLDVFVKDIHGRVERPWLTLLICRATRCIVGLHISFDVPSYATLARAVTHALCPKDVSQIPGVENSWSCHGVPDAIITDRGLEFLSESFRTAGRQIGFAVINLPGRCPYLKGTVERFFGTLNIRVLSRLEGTTLSRTSEFYDPAADARFTLGELTAKIVRWVVDEYHQELHQSLGTSPMAKWSELVDKFKVRPIKSFRHLITLLGDKVNRTVQNTGIDWEGHTYRSEELERLRQRRGGSSKKWEIRCDPYDRGEVWVLDEQRRTWIAVPAVHQKSARGVTKFQSRLQLRVARQMVPDGEPITDAVLEKAADLCTRDALTSHSRSALRYLANGALPTPVLGNIRIPVTAFGIAENESTPVPEPVASSASVQQHAVADDTLEDDWNSLLAARKMNGAAAC